MTTTIRAEWLKLVTTRTSVGLLGGAAVVGAIAAFIGTAQGPPPWDASEPLHAGLAWTVCVLAVTVLAVVVGSRTVTEEFEHETIAHTFVADPGRVRSLLAKATTAAAGSLVLAAAAVAALSGTVYVMAAVTGGKLAVFGSDVEATLGLFGAVAAMGVIGVGVGALVREPVATLVVVLLWFYAVENLLGLFTGPVAGYLPGKLAVALSGLPSGADGISGAGVAGALVAYAAALMAVGAFEMRRRDVL